MARTSWPPPSLPQRPSTRATPPATLPAPPAPASRPTLHLPPNPHSATARATQLWQPSSTRRWRTATQWQTRSVPQQPLHSSMQRLPRGRTRRRAPLLPTLISRRMLPTMGRGQRLAEKQLRPISNCFEYHLYSNFSLHPYLMLEKLEIHLSLSKKK